MTSTRFTASTPLGLFVRTSQSRVYTFVVASQGRTAEAVAQQREENLAYNRREAAEYRKHAAEGGYTYTANNLIRSKHFVDAATCIRYAEGHEERIAQILAEPEYRPEDYTTVWGWSSRRDLAEKVANTARARGYTKVGVFPVDEVAVKGKQTARNWSL